ncbi:MAG: ABC transporter permease [Parachlamydiales bacterium]|nr:ABC transporter permease [Verrucomicrobiota bacterium]MBX3719589.1 ABC transporter permease [Candidatus Acheromyda pituitae]
MVALNGNNGQTAANNHHQHPLLKRLYAALGFVISVGEYAVLIYDVAKATVRRPPHFYLILKQLFDIGVASLPVVAITGLSTGMVLAAQSFYQLSDKGLASVTGLMVAKAMMTELGPVLTAFMVTGRVGAAMCAELGTMQVTEQIDALKTMAVNPNRYLISPRFIAGVFMIPLLVIFSIVMGIFGGYLVAVYFFGMAPITYFDPMPTHITYFDFLTGVIKGFVFGILIMTIACYKGLRTSGGAAGVGRSTTNSVVVTYCCILFVNFFLTVGLNIIHDQLSGLLD